MEPAKELETHRQIKFWEAKMAQESSQPLRMRSKHATLDRHNANQTSTLKHHINQLRRSTRIPQATGHERKKSFGRIAIGLTWPIRSSANKDESDGARIRAAQAGDREL